MQGSFQDFNVDWGGILSDPSPDKLDEETSKLYHQPKGVLSIPRPALRRSVVARRRGRERGRGRVGTRGVVGISTIGFNLDVPEPGFAAIAEEGEDGADEDNPEGDIFDPDEGLDLYENEIEDPVETKPVARGSDSDDSDYESPEPDDEPLEAIEVPREPVFLGPYPPTMTFTVGEQYHRFYVIPGFHNARNGIMGHYLKPYLIDEYAECIPFPKPKALGEAAYEKHPDYYLPAGTPGLPWPNRNVCGTVKQAEDDGSPVIPTAGMLAALDWEHKARFIDMFVFEANKHKNTRALYAFELPRGLFNYRDPAQRLIFHHPGPLGDKDPSLPPDHMLMKDQVDFVMAPPPWERPDYYEIGVETLRRCVERAELMDLGFARRIMGLLGVSQDAVWACLDPDFNPADRQEVLDRFTSNYTQDFYKSVSWAEAPDARGVGIQAIQQHKAMCQVLLLSNLPITLKSALCHTER